MEPFILFGDQHVSTMIWTGITIVLFCILGNFINTKSQDLIAKLIGLSLIIFEITKPFIYIYGFDKPWQTYLPLHMCNFSAVLIGIFLLSKEKNQLFFELPFYWGIGGATMAIITPDLDFAWPDIEYFMFFYGHGQIILGIFFAMAVLKNRPYLENFWKMAVISILLLLPIYLINVVIGDFVFFDPIKDYGLYVGENVKDLANYWYLMDTPGGASLMDFMPSPPFHMLGVIPLSVTVFFVTYLPFLFWDKYKKA